MRPIACSWRHGFVGVGAERSAAVGDDLAVGGQLGEPVLQLLDRDRQGALDAPGFVLLRGAHVDEHDVAVAQPREQLVGADRAMSAARLDVPPGGLGIWLGLPDPVVRLAGRGLPPRRPGRSCG